jgi:FdhD protein
MTRAGHPGVRTISVHRASNNVVAPAASPDCVAVEEPLEIQVGFTNGTRQLRTVAVTMRTPGHDTELAAGYLFAEGLLRCPRDVATVLTHANVVRIELQPDVVVDFTPMERLGFVSSSCGVCGKTSIDAALAIHAEAFDGASAACVIDARVLASLPDRILTAQQAFERTGGLHAAALFAASGDLVALYEDVGRHNALDKLLGSRWLADALPAREQLVCLSGRASFELVQKCAAAGVEIVASVGAPSSLAIELAQECGITLAGFVRHAAFNLYSAPWRIR